MRTSMRTLPAALSLAALIILGASGCSGPDGVPVPGREDAVKSTAAVRAERRAYDGAPPTVPHESFGAACTSCHDGLGQQTPYHGPGQRNLPGDDEHHG